MAEDSRDILMKLVLEPGKPAFPAECRAIVPAEDELAGKGKDFTLGSPVAGVASPNYFAIEDFTFQVALGGDTSALKAAAAQKENAEQQQKALLKAMQDKMPELQGLKVNAPKDSSTYVRFLTKGKKALGAKSYPADLEEIGVTKQLDATSLDLLESCIKSVTFKSAVILKRKATGLTGLLRDGRVDTLHQGLRSYLRFDFTDVLITEFNWSEDDVLKETFKFVCRKAVVQYAVETPGGKLTTASTGSWASLNLSAKGTG